MAANAAVVIPVYKETLNEFEKISFAQVQKILGHYPIIFVAPQDLRIPYAAPTTSIYEFPPQFFQSVKTYNYLMTSPQFYEAFLDYEYILIYQLDAFVFSDELEYFCTLGYDYIGAPWCAPQKVPYGNKVYRVSVGNGGFCLRKVKTFYNILTQRINPHEGFGGCQEDVVFALCGKLYPDEFRVAPINVAWKFSVEWLAEWFIKKNGGKLPFGCHMWYRVSKELYKKVIPQYGYDLNALSAKMKDVDIESMQKSIWDYAMCRLIDRLKRGKSITRYLPMKNFASIRVLNKEFPMMIFRSLILENNTLGNEIYLYDEQDILLQDLKSARTPHLLITEGNDDALIEELTKRGVTYGDCVVSFVREYKNYCQRLFKNLGK